MKFGIMCSTEEVYHMVGQQTDGKAVRYCSQNTTWAYRLCKSEVAQ